MGSPRRSAGDDEDVEARAKGDAATKSTEPSTFAGNVTATVVPSRAVC